MDRKRKAEPDYGSSPNKPAKSRRKWHGSHTRPDATGSAAVVEPGVSGIWVTCERGREGRCVSEVRELFKQYAASLYGDPASPSVGRESKELSDIEADIGNEVQDLENTRSDPLFQHVRLDIKCVLFFRTRPPVDPVALVHKICADVQQGANVGNVSYVQRLTPITLTARATVQGLDELAAVVLARHFHADKVPSLKFAIRVNNRNHDTLKRATVIDRVAKAVGDRHTVDLDNPDLLILIEISHNTIGMAVVGSIFLALKRFNLAAIYDSRKRELHSKSET